MVLFNGLGERTPSWAWAQEGLVERVSVLSMELAKGGAEQRQIARMT